MHKLAPALGLLLSAAPGRAHPQYLDQLPNGHNAYFSSLPGLSSEGAIGHDSDKGGAHLNAFGKEYGGGDTWYASWGSAGGDLFEPIVKGKIHRVDPNFAS